MGEQTIRPETVEREHLKTIHQPAHWAYLVAVIGGGTALMLLFIAWLGAS